MWRSQWGLALIPILLEAVRTISQTAFCVRFLPPLRDLNTGDSLVVLCDFKDVHSKGGMIKVRCLLPLPVI